jgi:uncharacterized protein YfaS (alpha-2-macroglobulin family)
MTEKSNNRLTRYTVISFFICLFILLPSGCNLPVNTDEQVTPTGQQISIAPPTSEPTGEKTSMPVENEEVPMTLGEGQAIPLATQPATAVASEPLSESDIENILVRLPTLPTEEALKSDFKLAGELLPPPRTGKTVQQPFPPTAEVKLPEQSAAGPLEVVRFSPEGEIPVAPFISITFNQPMVPVTTLKDLSGKDIPVKVDPDLTGTWRWVGTKTLTFNYDSKLIDRLPKSTAYTVTIPSGTKSQTGGILEKAVEWKFTTPPVKITTKYPEGVSQPQNPLVFMAFDQRVDPASILKVTKMTAGENPVEIRLSTEQDWKANPIVNSQVKGALEGRWMVFQPVSELPLDTDISVNVGPDTPSAEGPLTSSEIQSFSFRTYSPLKVVDHGCSWGDTECRPLTPFFIRFNNLLDSKTFTESMVKVQPEIPGVTVNITNDTITIQGETKGRTTYTVTLDGTIQDIYGQKLGRKQDVSFKVGAAEKMLVGTNQNFITLDPASGEPVYSIYSVNYSNLDVQIYSVNPSDWPAFKKYLREYMQTDKPASIPGNKVFDGSVDVKSVADALTETQIKLKSYLKGNSGHFILIVKPRLGLFEKEQYWQRVQVWLQVTHLGLDAMADNSSITAWATDLRDGKPLQNVSISSDVSMPKAVTGETGLVTFNIPSGAIYLTASSGTDIALLPRSINYWGDDNWNPTPVSDELRWYLIDDRQMYKPGEEVHIKGWLRRIGGTQTGDVSLIGSDVSAISYTVTEPQGNEINHGEVKVNGLGGFDLAFTIPDKTNLGNAQIYFQAGGSLTNLSNTSFNHNFQIQEFRRPEFEVTARNDTPAPFFAGESAVAAVEAKYYAGGALPNAAVTWQVTTSPASYSPPNWSDFTFGTWTPWWIFDSYPVQPNMNVQTFTGVTDASGTHYLKVNFQKDSSERPSTVSAQATVMDVNRQAWTSTTSMLVHPASLYVGLKSDRYFVEKGTPIKIDLIVTDLDGNPVEDRMINAQAARLEWKYRDGRWSEEEADVQTCDIASGKEPVTCKFESPVGGSYRITAIVTDEKGRKNRTDLTRWVSGGKQEAVTLIPDKEKYQPGDTASILVQPPFTPAEGVLTISRSGIISTEYFRIEKDTTTLEIPITEAYIPNLNIQVDLTGSAPRVDDKGEAIPNVPNRPAYATASLNLKIPPISRTLDLKAVPAEKELEPGKETSVNVELKDSEGNPVSNAEVSVIVVDEAILALTNYNLVDPVSLFYSDRPSGFVEYYSRSNIILADPLALVQSASRELKAKGVAQDMAFAAGAPAPTMLALPAAAPMMEKAESNAAHAPAIRIRSDFNPLAAFSPSVMTDASGKASVPVKLPDNLTRYRVMAVAVSQDGKKFGSSESNLTARLPLMVRPSAPRFLNFGDEFELPIVLQNQTDSALTVDVAVRASNLELTGEHGKRITVPAHDRLEVRFPAKTISAGQVQFQAAAVSGDYSDAATISLPVYTPATTEGFATYGVLDEGTTYQPVQSPTEVFPQFGGLEITTSSTALQSLTDAVMYLVSYPFECSEQLSSRVLGVAALRDVLTAFKAKELPTPTEMEAAVQRDITRLQGMQNGDGGFPYWRRGQESIPFNTIHVAHSLQRAKLKGFDVPASMQQNLLVYLQQIESHYPAYYSQRTRQDLSAYALYVRNLMGDKDANKAAALIDQAGLDNLDLDAIGWLWEVLGDSSIYTDKVDDIRKLVNNRVVETAGAANFTTNYDDQNYLLLGSDRRTDAILLEALMLDNPQSDLIPKVVNGLLAHRQKGRWGSTQENVFVLLALDKYFNTYESQTPEFVANIWLGDQYAGSHTYSGYSTEYQKSEIPMNYLMDAVPAGESRDLVISKQGAGRLYYRLGLNYAPTDLTMKALDMGFVVERRYEAVDNPADVHLDEKGIWHIKAGAKVKVHLTMVADNRRYHVALSDPLPAGLEIINPELAVTGGEGQTTGTQVPRYGWWWHWNWFDHQNLRDERAEVFTSLLWDGVYEYSYIARATTPGQFVVPPTKAEEMYSPEVFGRSASDTVVVE